MEASNAKEYLEQIERDIDLCKDMATVTTKEEARDLTNRLISYQDWLNQQVAELGYRQEQFKGKRETLKEFMRTAKLHYQDLRELESEIRYKGKSN